MINIISCVISVLNTYIYGGGVCWEPWGPFSHSITQHLQYLCLEPPADGGGVTGAK